MPRPGLAPLALLLCACAAAGGGEASQGAPPNLVLILADDLGWGDLGVQGASGFETPNLDRLAKEGVRLTDFYAAQPACSASRASWLTGCYPNRIGLSGVLGPASLQGLSEEELTLAELCRSRGYATAIFGKWHLGHHAPFLPQRHGFDSWYGLPYSHDMWPYHPDGPRAYPDLPTLEDEWVVAWNGEQAGSTAEITRRALGFIDAQAERPFFLYLPYPMPHVPLGATEAYRGKSARGLYGDVIQELDAAVGRILEALDRRGIADRTLVIFSSDNGPWLSYGEHAGSAGPLREGKDTTFEGGVRVPFLARWPGQIPAGSVCREPAMSIDVLPTIAGLIGAELPSAPIDGLDIWPLLSVPRDGRAPHEALFFYNRGNDLEALRSGRWKLHFPHGYCSMNGRELGRGGLPGEYDYGVRTELELYDLQLDPGESRNVAEENPAVVERLRALADAMRADLGDALAGRPPSGAREPGRAAAP